MRPAPLEILYEDNHLLAVVKPVGLATMGVAEDRPSLLGLAKGYLKERYGKPGNVYLGAMSRLDAPVSGVVLFARTSKAAARLTAQFRARAVEKVYWAILPGEIQPAAGELSHWVLKDERHRRMHIVRPNTPGAQDARLKYRRLASLARGSLVEVLLETGRKHQIRLQLAQRGLPIVGDRKYGSREAFPAGIALHARRLVCTHPTQDVVVDLVAPVPAVWHQYGVRG